MGESLLIKAKGVTRTFKAGWGKRPVQALRGVDLEIHPAEVVALLGPNGSGKSTLLHCLLGVTPPDAGEITVMGLAPGNPKGLQKIGFVPEKDPPWGRLTGKEVLRFTAALHGITKTAADQGATELLEELGLKKAANRKIHGYSKGMARRLSLAAALLHKPTLLVLDEPTSGLDPLGSGLVLDRLKELRQQGTAILLSSHHFHEVEALADRAVILQAGKVAVQGEINQVLADRDNWEISVEGITPEGRKKLEALAAEVGILRRSRPARRGLDQVLRNTPRDQS